MDAARRVFAGPEPTSDLLVLVRAYKGWEDAADKGHGAQRVFCAKYCLSEASLSQIRDMRRQFVDLLAGIGFAPKGGGAQSGLNGNSNSEAVVCAVAFSGLYPNLLKVVLTPRAPEL